MLREHSAGSLPRCAAQVRAISLRPALRRVGAVIDIAAWLVQRRRVCSGTGQLSPHWTWRKRSPDWSGAADAATAGDAAWAYAPVRAGEAIAMDAALSADGPGSASALGRTGAEAPALNDRCRAGDSGLLASSWRPAASKVIGSNVFFGSRPTAPLCGRGRQRFIGKSHDTLAPTVSLHSSTSAI